MTEKELHRLRRQDLLQLLLAQGKEAAALQEQLEETQAELGIVTASNDRLKARLDEKDAQLERLKTRLDQKDARIRSLSTELEGLHGEQEAVAAAAALQSQVEELQADLAAVTASNDRLKNRLDEKDAQIERLKTRLDQKDERIRQINAQMEAISQNRRIQMEEAGSIAEAALRLNGVFEAAQAAADEYLENLRLLCQERAEGRPAASAPAGEGQPDADQQ
jgi:chromosome segregation ATPase